MSKRKVSVVKRDRSIVRWIRSLASALTIGALTSVAHAQTSDTAQRPPGMPAAPPDMAQNAPSVALFYGMHPPVAQLSAFDIAVVDPDAQFDPAAQVKSGSKSPGKMKSGAISDSQSEPQSPSVPSTHTAWFAYVSVGEINPQRAYFADVPKAWMPSINKDWASHVVDQTAAGWPTFFLDHVVTPLWRKGYRGFFLDTLDSYQLISHDDAQRTAQQAGLLKVIRGIKRRYPKAQLIFNRGFELMPQLHDQVYMVAFESLYNGWNAGKQTYTQVPQTDRDWLLGQAHTIRDQYKLPVLSIDYCAPDDTVCQRATVERIVGDGLIPYVTDGGLSTVGVGVAVLTQMGTDAAASGSAPVVHHP